MIILKLIIIFALEKEMRFLALFILLIVNQGCENITNNNKNTYVLNAVRHYIMKTNFFTKMIQVKILLIPLKKKLNFLIPFMEKAMIQKVINQKMNCFARNVIVNWVTLFQMIKD